MSSNPALARNLPEPVQEEEEAFPPPPEGQEIDHGDTPREEEEKKVES